jgi:hypothetical protein
VDRHTTYGIHLDRAVVVQLVLEASRALEGEMAVGHLPLVAVAVLGERPVVAEEDDPEPLRVRVVAPVVDAALRRLVAEDRLVGAHQEVAAVEPREPLGAGHGHTRAEHAEARVRVGPPGSEQGCETPELTVGRGDFE